MHRQSEKGEETTEQPVINYGQCPTEVWHMEASVGLLREREKMGKTQ